MPAIALTDTNNLFGAMEFTKKALEKKIQPILGANLSVKCYQESQNVKRGQISAETFYRRV